MTAEEFDERIETFLKTSPWKNPDGSERSFEGEEVRLGESHIGDIQYAVVSVHIVIERAMSRRNFPTCLSELKEIKLRMRTINTQSCGDAASAEFRACDAWIQEGVKIFQEILEVKPRVW